MPGENKDKENMPPLVKEGAMSSMFSNRLVEPRRHGTEQTTSRA